MSTSSAEQVQTPGYTYSLDETPSKVSTCSRFCMSMRDRLHPLFSAVLYPVQYLIGSSLKSKMSHALREATPISVKYEDTDGEQINTSSIKQALRLPNGTTLSNRLVKASITDGAATVHHDPAPCSSDLYRRYAKGGFGMVIYSGTSVDRNSTLTSFGPTPVLDDRSKEASYRELAQAMKSGSAKAIIQLTHPGPIVAPNQTPFAPSAFVTRSPHNMYARNCKVMKEVQVDRVLEQFYTSARLAEEYGFDGIQIVAAHGYLLSTFLSPNLNKREDRYSDSKVLIELMTNLVRNRKSERFSIGVKINSSDLQKGGLTPKQSVSIIKELDGLGIDLIEVGGGTYQYVDTRYSANQIKGSSSMGREAYFIDFAERLTREGIRTPFIVVGGWTNVEQMNAAVAANPNMLVGLGRATCVDPEIALKILDGSIREIPKWFQLHMPAWIREKANSPKRDVRRVAFAVEMMWYVFCTRSLLQGHRIPRVNGLFDNPIDALSFKIYYMMRNFLPETWQTEFFRLGAAHNFIEHIKND